MSVFSANDSESRSFERTFLMNENIFGRFLSTHQAGISQAGGILLLNEDLYLTASPWLEVNGSFLCPKQSRRFLF